MLGKEACMTLILYWNVKYKQITSTSVLDNVILNQRQHYMREVFAL